MDIPPIDFGPYIYLSKDAAAFTLGTFSNLDDHVESDELIISVILVTALLLFVKQQSNTKYDSYYE